MNSKSTGFTCPLHPYQLFSWLFTVFHISTWITILFDVNKITLAVSSVLLGVSQLTEIVAAFICTKSDPTDPLSISEKYDSSKDELFEAMCTKCNAFVEPHSKHCSVCNRCVSNFDHHCKWVNNCIGQKNYQSFFVMIIALEVNLLTSLTIEMVLISEVTQVVFVMIIIDAIISFVIICFNGSLIGFHLYLVFNHMTTFEYIIKRRSRNKVYSSVEKEESLKAERSVLNKPIDGTAEHTLKQISEENMNRFSARVREYPYEKPAKGFASS